MDKFTPEQRHYCMSRIRSNDTKPEMLVRRWLHGHGYRYGLHNKKLPGSPDIVLRRLKTVVFVNGCFWHGHNVAEVTDSTALDREVANSACCKIPQSNRPFWLAKINRNRERDAENVAALRAKGWRVLTIWECELKPSVREATLNRLLALLSTSPTLYAPPEVLPSIAAEDAAPYGATD